MAHIPFPMNQANTLKLCNQDVDTVYSENYGDIYFQPTLGVDEKKHVFLKGNNLPENWKDLKSFTIAETGFGTGLNFVNTMKLWNETTTKTQHLHFISCELHPLKINQLKQIWAQFPELSKYSEQLINKYPQVLTYGLHRIHFDTLRITLTLIIGDAATGFKQLLAKVDAWFLDGFAPSKNASMWSDDLFDSITQLSHVGTTLATYTVARKIRDALQKRQFSFKKTQGFGQKREMLTATMTSEYRAAIKQPWAKTFKAQNAKTYTIIGAGIAGLCLAQKLLNANKKVLLIDRQAQALLETSGNPQAIVMPSFTLNDSVEARFYLSAFLYALQHYKAQKSVYHKDGVLLLPYSEKQKQWQNELIKRFNLPKSLVQAHKKGLLLPSAGWLDTQGYAQSLMTSKLIQNRHFQQAEIKKIAYNNKQWHLFDKKGQQMTTDCLILANGIGIKTLLPDYQMPLSAKHGQISCFHPNKNLNEIMTNQHVHMNKGYITPQWNNQQLLGATFDHLPEKKWQSPPHIDDNHWQKNAGLWKNTEFEEILSQIKPQNTRAGIRVTSPDHLPICGALCDQKQFTKDYHDICHGKKYKTYPDPIAIENLYVITALGSRGFTSAPILAESLCNQILATPQVLSKEQIQAISPNRFLFKFLKRHQ